MLIKLHRTKAIFSLLILALLCVSPVDAKKQKLKEKDDPDAFYTLAKQALLIDKATGTVIYEKNAKDRMPTSSMSKVVLLYPVFKAIEEGRAKLTDMYTVSPKARAATGSRMFLEVNTKVSLKDLIYGIVVQSGNDAAICLAEGLFGSEEAAVDVMNQTAQDLGLKDSHFQNVIGFHHEDHYMSSYDLATMAMRIMDDFPKYYKLFGVREFTYNEITQPNRNPLLRLSPPGDGLKTGYTHKGGYGLMGSAYRDHKRLILVINGLPTMWNREMEARKLLDKGFDMYKSYPIFHKNEVVDVADVWLGDKEATRLVIKDNVIANVFKKRKHEMKVELVYNSPLKAPIAKDQPVGELRLTAPGMSHTVYPVYAQDEVKKVSGFKRINSALSYLVFGSNKAKLIDRDPNQVDLPDIKYN